MAHSEATTMQGLHLRLPTLLLRMDAFAKMLLQDPDPDASDQNQALLTLVDMAQSAVEAFHWADWRLNHVDPVPVALFPAAAADVVCQFCDVLRCISRTPDWERDELLQAAFGGGPPSDRAELFWGAVESPPEARAACFRPIQRVLVEALPHSKDVAAPMVLFHFWDYLHHHSGYALPPIIDWCAVADVALGEATAGAVPTIAEREDALVDLVDLAHRLAPNARIDVEGLTDAIRSHLGGDTLNNHPPLCHAIATLLGVLRRVDEARARGSHPPRRSTTCGIYLFDADDANLDPILRALGTMPRGRDMAEVRLYNFWNFMDMRNLRA